MAEPILSIVVPFYGVEDYIADCLESLRRQTLREIEIVCVDDGSMDGSLGIAEIFASDDPRFRILRQENQGLGPARNAGAVLARGKYLAFVDSDDLVAPRGYSRLVNSLETTNSVIAAGNALRFSRRGFVTQSYAHRLAFEVTRRGTNIRELPELADDRMVWNKVYRRDFWQNNGFQFPAIRYEDYPVTLPAYLAASAVDVLQDHVYFWRVRAGGTSITQQTFKLDNLRDRFQSDFEVLDAIETSPLGLVARRVQSQFVDVDLVAFAEALVVADGDDRDEVWSMARRLAARLPEVDRQGNKYFADRIHEAIRYGDINQAMMLGRWRLNRSIPQLLRTVVAEPTRGQGRLIGDVAVQQLRRRRFRFERRLRAHLVSVQPIDAGLAITVRPQINRLSQRISHAAMYLCGRDREVEIPIDLDEQDGEILITGFLSDQTENLSPQTLTTYGLVVTLSAGPFQWRGQILTGDVRLPGAFPAKNGAIQAVSRYVPQAYGDCLRFSFVRQPILISEVSGDNQRLRIQLEGILDGQITVHMPYPTDDITVPVEVEGAYLDRERLLSAPVLDNPVTGRVDRAITYVDRLGNRHNLTIACETPELRWSDYFVSVIPNREGHAVVHSDLNIDRSLEAATETILISGEELSEQMA